jgi:putative membrane protein
VADTAPGKMEILAIDRTRLAAERTLMAWVRTSLAMISFGFAIYKFVQVFQEQSSAPALRPHAPRNMALALIGIGTFALVTACIQYRSYMKELSPGRIRSIWDLTFIVGWLIALLGILTFGSILLRSGPLA